MQPFSTFQRKFQQDHIPAKATSSQASSCCCDESSYCFEGYHNIPQPQQQQQRCKPAQKTVCPLAITAAYSTHKKVAAGSTLTVKGIAD